MDRRQFIQLIGAGAMGLAVPGVGLSDDKSKRKKSRTTINSVPGNTGANGKVIVVGGGMAGATAAKYLRLWGGAGVDVTLIERSQQYTACILSNLVLNGSRSINKQIFNYAPLAQKYGIHVINGEVAGIDTAGHFLSVGSNNYTYDKLVIAPGIDFDPIPMTGSALEQANIFHAWKAGPQTTALRDQILAMAPGAVFVLTIPLAPIRAAAGPYDRACIVADYLLHNKPGAKVIVLDANLPTNPADPYSAILTEKVNFKAAFTGLYGAVIEYHPGVTVSGIDATNLMLHTTLGDVEADVINAIPSQHAGAIIAGAGLNNANGGRWAGVNVLTYESTAAADVHILGDSASVSPQPKGGHVANAQAKVCADAIARMLRGEALDPSPVTSSSVFSPIGANTASWLSAVYKYVPPAGSATLGTMAAVEGPIEAGSVSQKNFSRMQSWFTGLMADTFV